MEIMIRLLPLLFIPFLFSCKKNQSTALAEESAKLDLSGIFETDDYFKQKRKSGRKGADSLQHRMVELRDINSDGTSDTAFIVYNEINSRYKISFSCYEGSISLGNIAELQVKDMSDLNGDGHSEIMLFLQSEESCWDEIRLYSWLGKWVEKYNGLTYQCTEDNQNNYQFRKIDEHTVQLTTYGVNRDSFDAELGDTLENIIPNAMNSHLISW